LRRAALRHASLIGGHHRRNAESHQLLYQPRLLLVHAPHGNFDVMLACRKTIVMVDVYVKNITSKSASSKRLKMALGDFTWTAI
jgi:ABC-type uncharacterized transport system YnjBCD ATPase subunit